MIFANAAAAHISLKRITRELIVCYQSLKDCKTEASRKAVLLLIDQLEKQKREMEEDIWAIEADLQTLDREYQNVRDETLNSEEIDDEK